ncbi:MAG TPA: hypothetical protein VKT77_08015 [Chthonomonadaceae bacterium]|nr:hypothetical protein [Chthonomonadaceae bacterium]
MKIESHDLARRPASTRPASSRPTRGLYARAGFALIGAAAMIGGLRWAMITTSANERQVASTLTTLQGKIEAPPVEAGPFPEARLGKLKAHRSRNKSAAGPAIEPSESR